jgi:hypothetical protein
VINLKCQPQPAGLFPDGLTKLNSRGNFNSEDTAENYPVFKQAILTYINFEITTFSLNILPNEIRQIFRSRIFSFSSLPIFFVGAFFLLSRDKSFPF